MPTNNIISAISEIGCGDCAISELPNGYTGPCNVKTNNGSLVAVLPNPDEAFRVASYAITQEGGYGSVVVDIATGEVTHQSFECWVT